jgi:peptidoglycan L-alanyl-D-glutamate endopeptidase CwlK
MSYAFGAKSLSRLNGVHRSLVAVAERAIAISTQDFTVQEGLRSLETQRAYLAKGVTKTLKSLHLVQADGFGHALDLVPFEGGMARWEWPLIYPVAAAMHQAAHELNTPLTWGGVWDRPLLSLPGDAAGLAAAVRDYCTRHPGPDFLDGPHYQLA